MYYKPDNNYKNYETYKFKEDFLYGDFSLSFFYEDDEILQMNKDKTLKANVIDMLKSIGEDSIGCSVNYRLTSDAYNWAMLAMEKVDYETLADEVIEDWLFENNFE